MPLLHNELARWKNGQLELRPQPLRVRWVFEDLVTSDGHALRCTFSCSVQGLSDPTERRMLQEVLLQGHHSVTDGTVAAHFAPALRGAAERAAQARTVAVAEASSNVWRTAPRSPGLICWRTWPADRSGADVRSAWNCFISSAAR